MVPDLCDAPPTSLVNYTAPQSLQGGVRSRKRHSGNKESVALTPRLTALERAPKGATTLDWVVYPTKNRGHFWRCHSDSLM